MARYGSGMPEVGPAFQQPFDIVGLRDNPMPQWLTGLVVGVIVAWTTQWLQTLFRRGQYRHEKLMDRYAELISTASADLDRAKSLEAGMALSGRDGDYGELLKLEEQRHGLRRDLQRAALLIRMIESEPDLNEKVENLVKRQPFMAFPIPPTWGEGNFDERFTQFKSDVVQFETCLSSLADAVLEHHAVAKILPLRMRKG